MYMPIWDTINRIAGEKNLSGRVMDTGTCLYTHTLLVASSTAVAGAECLLTSLSYCNRSEAGHSKWSPRSSSNSSKNLQKYWHVALYIHSYKVPHTLVAQCLPWDPPSEVPHHNQHHEWHEGNPTINNDVVCTSAITSIKTYLFIDANVAQSISIWLHPQHSQCFIAGDEHHLYSHFAMGWKHLWTG